MLILRMALMLLLIAGTARGNYGTTGALVGRVLDGEKHEGIPGVQILLVGTSLGGSTDDAGRFHIVNIRAGVYDVRCSMIGYTTSIVKSVIILPDLRNEITITLNSSPVELAPVEVTAQQPMISKDQPMTAFSIGGKKVTQLPVSTVKEILALQPSTTVEGNVRGGKVNDIVYLVDGIPMQDVIAGGQGAAIPKSSIAGMTVMTGGYEAEYGNSLSGVVNLITRPSADHHTVQIRAEKDNLLPTSLNDQIDRYTELELAASGPIVPGKLSYLSANTFTLSDTRWWSDFQYFFSSPISRQWNGLEKLEYSFSPQSRLSLQGVLQGADWHDYEYSWRYTLGGLPPRHRNANRIAAMYTTMLSPRVYTNISLSRFALTNRIGDGGLEALLQTPHPQYEYDLFLQYIISGSKLWQATQRQTTWTMKGDITDESLDRHFIKAGFELNRYAIASDLLKYEPQLTYFGKPDTSLPLLNYSNRYDYQPWSGSVFVQDKITLDADGSQASFGLRWDFLNPRAERPVVEFVPVGPNDYREKITGTAPARFKHQLSPRIALSTSMDPQTFLFVNFGQYFQFPLFDYLYAGLSPVQIRQGAKNVLTGNPDLEPERTIQWELGVKRQMGARMVLAATLFRKNMENQVDTKTFVPSDSKFAGDYGYAGYINNATATSSGLELVLSRENDDRLSGSISYTYMSAEGTSEYADQTLNRSQWGFVLLPSPYPLSWDQRHTLKMDLLSILPLGIEANLVLLYNSPRPYTSYPSRDGFTPSDTSLPFIPNNARMTDVATVNLKFQKKFILGTNLLRTLTIAVDGRNILNRENVKWIDSNGRIGGELSDPGAYYDPRRVRIGLIGEW